MASLAPSPVPPTKTEALAVARSGSEDELWWGEEWKDVQIKGESPTMISPGVMIADRLRNPSLAGCRNQYRVTVEGSDATGIPAGSVLEGPAKKVRMEIARPYPAWSAGVQTPVQVHGDPRGRGPAHGDPVRGLRWGLFDGSVLADEPVSRGGACKNDRRRGGRRLFERDNVNTTLVENALGDPLSKTLVLDPVVESDLKGAFFCKLESTRRNDVVSVFRGQEGWDRGHGE
ncbi:hypothetical protein Q5P01_000050 [Channa striata]|uniref:Uncharacterized protein n=1 Tax=Channa striata TaxID=64152 RepID=A0AA88ICL8_CHASR|nr:hypothetical protein Q5P01_000050 [Channa striata]